MTGTGCGSVKRSGWIVWEPYGWPTRRRAPGDRISTVHAFYSLLVLMTGVVLIQIAAFGRGRPYRGQVALLTAGALIALVATLIPVFNLVPQAGFNPYIPGFGASSVLYALAIFRFGSCDALPRSNIPETYPTGAHWRSSWPS